MALDGTRDGRCQHGRTAATIARTVALPMRTGRAAATVAIAIVIGSCVNDVAPPDVISPPTNVTVTLVGTSSARITWTPPPEAVYVDSYNVLRDDVKLAETTSTSYQDDNLLQGVTYKYRISANGQLGIPGQLSAETSTSAITIPDITPPTVTSATPAAEATGVASNAAVTVTFSEPMDAATINSTNFFLKTSGGALIPGAVVYTAATRTAAFTPTSALPSSTTLIATVTSGAKDVAGNGLAAIFSLSFTTRDETPPSVVSTSPVAGASAVPVSTAINVTFSETIDAATLTAASFTLAATSGGASISGAIAFNAATKTATLTPSSSLAGSTSYTATIAGTVKDLAGNAMGTAFSFAFTTADITPPNIVAVSPANGSSGVASNATVDVAFSKAMNASTINASSVLLKLTSSGASVTGTVSYNAATFTATFLPSAPLSFSTGYTVIVTTDAKDTAGNSLTTGFSSEFSVETAPDTTAPTVISVTPVNGAAGVTVTDALNLTFSEPMDQVTINGSTVTLTNSATLTLIPATVAYSADTNTATLTPTSPLTFGTGYVVTVGVAAKDLAGNPLAATFTSTFTTATAPDVTPPTVLSAVPSNGATNVAVLTPVTVTFSEAMNPATINTSTIMLRLTSNGVVISGSVSYDGFSNTATFAPSAGTLAYGIGYTLSVSGVADVAGNALAAPFSATFTTVAAPDTNPPTVTTTSPLNGATGVAVGVSPTVTFSEAMDQTTINGATVTLRNSGTLALIPATVSYNAATMTANLAPSASLSFSTSYTITVGTGAKDLAGNGLLADFTATFTTGAAPDLTPPTVTATVPANGATGVALSVAPTVTFSEPMNAATISGSTVTLTATVSGNPVAGTVSYDSPTKTATFTPSSQLAFSTSYTLRVTTGVHDAAGNAMATAFSASFTTVPNPDTTRPTVISFLTLGKTGPPLENRSITSVTFSEAMDQSTINSSTVTVRPDTTNAPLIPGTVTYDANTNTATFASSQPLGYVESLGPFYTLTITTGATDLAGNGLAANFFISTKRRPYFQGTSEENDNTGKPQIHVHITFSQSGQTLGRAVECQPLPQADCSLLPRNSAGVDAVGPLDDTQGGTVGIAATVTALSGTFTNPGITFDFTLANGRTFTFSGSMTDANTMTGTLSGATLAAPVAITLAR